MIQQDFLYPDRYPFRSLTYAVKIAQHAQRGYMDRELLRVGLTAPQFSALSFVYTSPGSSNADIARLSFVTAQTMQAILAGLERAGLIVRTPHPTHGRILIASLTTAGHQALDAGRKVMMDAEAIAVASIEPLMADDLIAAFFRWADSLSAQIENL